MNMINEKIKEILKEFNIPLEDGIPYLLSLNYGYNPSYIPSNIIKKVNMTKIYENDNDKIKWNIPLYEEEGSISGFEWVKDWRKLFKIRNKDREGNLKLCITRMKKFFTENPEIRKEDVFNATDIYFKSLNSYEFLTTSQYFIYKGKGVERFSMLKDWVKTYKENFTAEKRISYSNTIK